MIDHNIPRVSKKSGKLCFNLWYFCIIVYFIGDISMGSKTKDEVDEVDEVDEQNSNFNSSTGSSSVNLCFNIHCIFLFVVCCVCFVVFVDKLIDGIYLSCLENTQKERTKYDSLR